MKHLIFVCLSLILISGNCKEEGPDCHLKITIKNNSNQAILVGSNIKNTSNDCNLSLSILIEPNEFYDIENNGQCWEDILAIQTKEIYLVDSSHFEVPGIFYDCDSIEIKNMVLKHYILTLDDLKQSNFTITYP